ncbi:hypothetical protein VHEMI07172 [[Torrubiella] hemipterigena]|uniref:sn-1-specific diacylglycerol lipase n=1 Tax=[Torrubiella] hemipterigena TaxID=1531966 RepID=A0A0A1TME4_9HYPO|nr:hypothetical protein VHEMI07172 [[Torrubiella] hemipterigena]
MTSSDPPNTPQQIAAKSQSILTTPKTSNQSLGPTLLPSPIAHAVSLATRSTSFAIRLGSLVSAYGLDAARFTTLSSLELARGLVEVVLIKAGKDTATSAIAAADAESVLEKSLESLHYAVIQVVFWTSASFRLTGTTLSAASEASQIVLSSLDRILGSTDSSRAVASIITLIRREFRNPITGNQGEKVGVTDLVLALSALAYLQQSCYRFREEEDRRRSYEEVIWDVVVLNDGERVDIDNQMALQRGYSEDQIPSPTTPGDMQHAEDDVVLERLRHQIISSLPADTKVTISNSVSTIQTIAVDVEGPDLPALPTPPGAEIVETSIIPAKPQSKSWLSYGGDESQTSSYRVVYKLERDKFRSMVFSGNGAEDAIMTDAKEDDPKDVMQYDAASGTFKAVPNSPRTVPQVKVEAPPKPERRLSAGPPATGTQTAARAQSRLSRSMEPAANQKKARTPANGTPERTDKHRADSSGVRKPVAKRKGDAASLGRSTDKKTGLKQALKEGGQSLSNIWNKDGVEPSQGSKSKSGTKPERPLSTSSAGSVKSKPLPSRPQRNNERTIASRRSVQTPEILPRSSSRASYVSIQDRRRDSLVSQTDTYTMTPAGGLQPASPTVRRSDVSTSQDSTLWARAEAAYGAHSAAPRRGHRRHGSAYAPSLYSLATNDSQTSLVLSSYYKKSAYSATDALETLRREGFVDGTFPSGHLLPNIVRYMRFSSACYGSNFMKFLGISSDMPTGKAWDTTHHDVRHFAHHTESDAGNILLASFVDPQGGTDATGATGTGVPLVHYISLDHEAKAVVLACRGTLGFEDVMTDMACEFDDLVWKGHSYQVHKGMHASARRLLYGGDGRVLFTLKAALQEFSDYGLVLCGHSLGAGVTSLLGLMLSEPNRQGPGFVTASESLYTKMITDGSFIDHSFSDVKLPPGRRIHVYAYGPPGVMSSGLRKITRGLITSVVHGSDLVPHLSLGLLHDFQALALAFKNKENRTKTEIRARLWAAFQNNLSAGARRIPSNDEDAWMLPALQALRDTMTNNKLLPPGEVFTVETQRVLRRDAFVLVSERQLGRPAQRVVLKYIRDVEGRFGEARFGTSMLTDHSPANYESALNKLKMGVVE